MSNILMYWRNFLLSKEKKMKKPVQIKNDFADAIKSGPEEMDRLIDEFNSTGPLFDALGFSVANFQIDINTPPSILFKIVGDISAMDTEALQTYIDDNPGKKTMAAVLKGFQTAFKLQDKIIAIGMRYVVTDIKLGVTPSVAVNFTKALA